MSTPYWNMTDYVLGAAYEKFSQLLLCNKRICCTQKFFFFFLNDPAPPEFYPLPLHDALPISGEVFPPKYLRRLMALAPQARCANLYGPTETNVCTWLEVPAPPAGDTPLPIGRACPFDEALVLDSALRPVPAGGVGELWIRGASVMQG